MLGIEIFGETKISTFLKIRLLEGSYVSRSDFRKCSFEQFSDRFWKFVVSLHTHAFKHKIMVGILGFILVLRAPTKGKGMEHETVR